MPAESVGEIEATLRLRDEMSGQLAAATRSMQRSLQNAGTTVKAFGERTQQIGMNLLPLAAGVGAVGVASLKMAGDFEAGMNRVRAVTGIKKTSEDFAQLEAQAKELGRTTTYTAREAADAMGFLGLAGFKTSEILGAMPKVLQLAASAQLDVASAADITAKTMRGYGLEVEELGRVNDVMVKSFTMANTDLTQLGEAFKMAGPVANVAGMEFEETSAALSLMADAGFQATLGGTALRGAIANLTGAVPTVTKKLKAMGIETLDSQGKMLPMVVILRQLEDAGLGAGEIMQLFGKRAGPAMAALIDRGSLALADFTAMLKESGGTAAKIEQVQLEGLRGAWIKFKSALEGVSIELGQQLQPTAERFLNWMQSDMLPRVQEAIEKFGELNPKIKDTALALGTLTAVSAPLLILIGITAKAASGLLLIGSAILSLMTWIGGFIPSLATLRAALLAVQINASVLWTWFSNLGGVAIILRKALVAVGAAFAGISAPMAAVIGALVLAIPTLLKWLGIWDPLMDALKAFGGVIVEVAGYLVDFAKRALLDAIDKLKDLSSAIGGRLSTAWKNFKADVLAAKDAVKTFVQNLGEIPEIKILKMKVQYVADRASETGQRIGAARDLADLNESLPGLNLPQNFERDSEAYAKALDRILNQFERLGTLGSKAALTQGGASGSLPMGLPGLLGPLAVEDLPDANEIEQWSREVVESIDDVAEASDDLKEAMDRISGRAAAAEMAELAQAVDGVGGISGIAAGQVAALVAQIKDLKQQGAEVPEALQPLLDLPVFGAGTSVPEAVGDTFDPWMDAFAELDRERERVWKGMATDLPPEVGDTFDTTFQNLSESLNGLDDQREKMFKTWQGDAKQIFLGLGDVIISAFTGGGNPLQAIGGYLGGAVAKGFAGTISETTGDLVGGLGGHVGGFVSKFAGEKIGGAVGSAVGSILPGLGTMLGGLAGKFIGSLFGGGEGAKANDLRDNLMQQLGGSLDAAHKLIGEHGNDPKLMAAWNQFYFGSSQEAVQKGFDQFKARLEELQQRAQEIIGKIGDLEGAVTQFGGVAPKALQPMIEELLTMNGLTDEQRRRLQALQGDPSWESMAEAAERLGVSFESLGPRFQQERISEAALQLKRDLELLADGGADMNAVLTQGAGKINELVQDAIASGAALPETLKPYIEKLIEMGLLVDKDGELITNIDNISFANIEDEPLQLIKDILEEIRDLLRGDIPAALGTAQDAFNDFDPTINGVGFVGGRGRGGDDPDGLPGYAGGSGGIRDFGRGTLAVLHGREAVLTEAQYAAAMSGGGVTLVVNNPVFYDRRGIDQLTRAVGDRVVDKIKLRTRMR